MRLMHAGWPLTEELLGLLYAHPHVCVDVGVIVSRGRATTPPDSSASRAPRAAADPEPTGPLLGTG